MMSKEFVLKGTEVWGLTFRRPEADEAEELCGHSFGE